MRNRYCGFLTSRNPCHRESRALYEFPVTFLLSREIVQP